MQEAEAHAPLGLVEFFRNMAIPDCQLLPPLLEPILAGTQLRLSCRHRLPAGDRAIFLLRRLAHERIGLRKLRRRRGSLVFRLRLLTSNCAFRSLERS